MTEEQDPTDATAAATINSDAPSDGSCSKQRPLDNTVMSLANNFSDMKPATTGVDDQDQQPRQQDQHQQDEETVGSSMEKRSSPVETSMESTPARGDSAVPSTAAEGGTSGVVMETEMAGNDGSTAATTTTATRRPIVADADADADAAAALGVAVIGHTTANPSESAPTSSGDEATASNHVEENGGKAVVVSNTEESHGITTAETKKDEGGNPAMHVGRADGELQDDSVSPTPMPSQDHPSSWTGASASKVDNSTSLPTMRQPQELLQKEQSHAEQLRKGQEESSNITAASNPWEELALDAEEYAVVAFKYISRPTARRRLLDLAARLKDASEKIKAQCRNNGWALAAAAAGPQSGAQTQQQQEVGEDVVAVTSSSPHTLMAKSGMKRSADDSSPPNGTKDGNATSNSLDSVFGLGPRIPRKKVKTEPDISSSSNSTGSVFIIDRTPGTSSTAAATTVESVLSTDKNDTATMIIPPPLLRKGDPWVQNHTRHTREHCPSFERTNTCPLDLKCNLRHVYRIPPNKIYTEYYTRENLEEVYKLYRKVPLASTDYKEKIKADDANKPWYCSSLICPVDRIIYYPYGGKRGRTSTQSIWWYPTMKEARDVVATIVIAELKSRGIVPKSYAPPDPSTIATASPSKSITGKNKVPSTTTTTTTTTTTPIVTSRETLPEIHPWNWMEVNTEKRCTHFNHPTKRCTYGSRCIFAHVFYPQAQHIRTDAIPHPDALRVAYRINFNLQTFNPQKALYSKYSLDKNGKIWYTAAWRCPVENTIYYAAGGKNFHVNTQNFCLYPTLDDAKAAVAGVVLNAFQSRGLHGGYDITSGTNGVKEEDEEKNEKGNNKTEEAGEEEESVVKKETPNVLQYSSSPEDVEASGGDDGGAEGDGEDDEEDQDMMDMFGDDDDEDEEGTKNMTTSDESGTAVREMDASSGNNIIGGAVGGTDEEPKDHCVEKKAASSLDPPPDPPGKHEEDVEQLQTSPGESEQNDNDDRNKGPNLVVNKPTNPSLSDGLPPRFLSNYKWSLFQRKECPLFKKDNFCPSGANCSLSHVYTPKEPFPSTLPPEQMLHDIYKQYRHVPLALSDFEEIEIESDGKSWHTAALVCPVDKTVYRAAGGHQNAQQPSETGIIYWYASRKEAREAVAAIVLEAFRDKGIIPRARSSSIEHAVSPSSDLPVLRHTDWMVPASTKHCRDFALGKGCQYGAKCKFAHVHYPHVVKNSSSGIQETQKEAVRDVPHKDALQYAYLKNFRVELKPNAYTGTSMLDSSGKRWYTCGVTCPHEQVIYYASGGKNVKVNSQGIHWYPSEDDAKAAVAAVILRSFASRGLFCSWKNPFES